MVGSHLTSELRAAPRLRIIAVEIIAHADDRPRISRGCRPRAVLHRFVPELTELLRGHALFLCGLAGQSDILRRLHEIVAETYLGQIVERLRLLGERESRRRPREGRMALHAPQSAVISLERSVLLVIALLTFHMPPPVSASAMSNASSSSPETLRSSASAITATAM